MALAAAQVVDALAALLAPIVATGGRVYTSRAWPLTEADLPAWRVTAAEEYVEPSTLDRVNTHRLGVEASAYARATADLDDTLHALASSGSAALFAGTPPYGLQLAAIERDLVTEGEASVGRITLRVQATYFVNPAAPETLI